MTDRAEGGSRLLRLSADEQTKRERRILFVIKQDVPTTCGAQAEDDAVKIAADAEAYRIEMESKYITDSVIQKETIIQ